MAVSVQHGRRALPGGPQTSQDPQGDFGDLNAFRQPNLLTQLFSIADGSYGCLGRGRGRFPMAPPVANPVAPSAVQRVSGGTPQTRFRFLRPTHRPSGPRQPGPPREPQLSSLTGVTMSEPCEAPTGREAASAGPATTTSKSAITTGFMVGSD